jgi:hypothetical protein
MALHVISRINEGPPVLAARDIFVTTGTSAAHVSSNLGKEKESKTHDLKGKLWRRLGAFGIKRSNPTSGHLLLAMLVHPQYFFPCVLVKLALSNLLPKLLLITTPSIVWL